MRIPKIKKKITPEQEKRNEMNRKRERKQEERVTGKRKSGKIKRPGHATTSEKRREIYSKILFSAR